VCAQARDVLTVLNVAVQPWALPMANRANRYGNNVAVKKHVDTIGCVNNTSVGNRPVLLVLSITIGVKIDEALFSNSSGLVIKT
jgi:hypothetical protein